MMRGDLARALWRRARGSASRPALWLTGTGEEVAYGRLRLSAERTAGLLRDHGCGPGETVGVSLPNGLDWILSVLGLLRIGAVPLLLDPDLSGPETASLLRDCRASLLLRGSRNAVELSRPFPAGSVLMRADRSGASALEARSRWRRALPPSTRRPPEGPALIYHTSGTTRRPRGVPLTDSMALARCRALTEAFRLSASDKALCVLPLAHGFMHPALTSLLNGGTLALSRELRADSLGLFWSEVERSRASTVQLIPALVRLLVELDIGRRESASVRRLRFVSCTSAPLDAALAAGFSKRFGTPIVNGYALKETGCIAASPLPRPEVQTKERGLRPLGRVRVLDARGRRLPPGKEGEIAFRGPTVAQGYCRADGGTETFLQRGWFLTGDTGLLDARGRLHLRGRRKDFIIHSGRKVDPEEVEKVLRSHPSVRDAAVLGIPDPYVDERVIACVVPRRHPERVAAELLDRCRRRLARYKLPVRIVAVSEIPRTSLGKPRRELLRRRFGATRD